ncbi:MAG TPA: sigma-54 dependent transcriptional regulator [Geobacteraceae bacterium]|nr:sigma-54 dependent transcriptional regulator [Geobacteraceae bacterium]
MSNQPGQRIMLIDDDVDFLEGMKRVLQVNGFRSIAPFSCATEAIDSLEKEGASAILLDMVMPGITGRDLLPLLMDKYPDTPVIISSAVSEVDNVVSCMKIGAYDYLVKPIDATRLVQVVTNALRLNALNLENRRLKKYLLGTPLSSPEQFARIITRNARMKAIFKLIETFATTMHPILLTGETGAGKELVATVIHGVSGVKGEFVPFNAGGLDGSMFIDTLFGHVKGAHPFVGNERGGLIQRAQGGTLFLDEVGDLSNEAQIALLRLLQEGEYYRTGSDTAMCSNARIIAASNRDLRELINSGRFRRDLYHRLSAHQIDLPPLRERSEDIPLLLQHYVNEEANYLRKTPPEIAPELIDALSVGDYPGNVRELINMIRNGVALNSSGTLTLEDFPGLPQVKKTSTGLVRLSQDESFTIHAIFDKCPSLEEFERLIIEETIKLTGSKASAADILGITRPTLNRKLHSVVDEG